MKFLNVVFGHFETQKNIVLIVKCKLRYCINPFYIFNNYIHDLK